MLSRRYSGEQINFLIQYEYDNFVIIIGFLAFLLVKYGFARFVLIITNSMDFGAYPDI